jgi:hypothetical protein
MNNYKKSLIAQYCLLLIASILVGVYTKNQTSNGISNKIIKIYVVASSLAFISLVYLVYYTSKYGENSDDIHIVLNRIVISCYLFFITIFCLVFIYNSKSKYKRVSLLNRIILYLAGASTIILFLNLILDKPYTSEHVVALTASAILMSKAVIGDAIIWPKYFLKN